MNIAINGFGRIGRTFLRTILLDQKAKKSLTPIAINIGPSNPDLTAYMFKYDSLMGTFPGNVSMDHNKLNIDDITIEIITEPDPKKIDWKKRHINWIVEASGHFTTRERAYWHIDPAGAQNVLITAPAEGVDSTIVPGINDDMYKPKDHSIVSLGSCTTNAVVPLLHVLHHAFIIECAMMTTVHAYTNSQVLLDLQDNHPGESRAAAINIIPMTTGATKVVTTVMPDLEGKFYGIALRVPVPKVSLIDLAFHSKKTLNIATVNHALEEAAQEKLRAIMAVSHEPLVSTDYYGNPYSVIIDEALTMASGNMAKVYGWYDNEWGYSERVKDFLMSIS